MEDANSPVSDADISMEQAPAPDSGLGNQCFDCGLYRPVEDQSVVTGCEI